MFILHFIVIGMGRPFLTGCTNKVIIIIIIIVVIIIIKYKNVLVVSYTLLGFVLR